LTLSCQGDIAYVVTNMIAKREGLSQAAYLRRLLFEDMRERGLLDGYNKLRSDVLENEGVVLIPD
jgi:hypothetical protein